MKKWILSIPLFLMFSGISYCVSNSKSAPVPPTSQRGKIKEEVKKRKEEEKKRKEKPCILEILVRRDTKELLLPFYGPWKYFPYFELYISVYINGKKESPKEDKKEGPFLYTNLESKLCWRIDTFERYFIEKGATVKITARLSAPWHAQGEIEFVIEKDIKVGIRPTDGSKWVSFKRLKFSGIPKKAIKH